MRLILTEFKGAKINSHVILNLIIKVVDSLKSSSQYKGQALTQGEKDTLSAAFDDLEQTVAPKKDALSSVTFEQEFPTINPKKDIFGLTPKVQDDLISDFEMLGNSQNQIVTNKQIKDIIEIKNKQAILKIKENKLIDELVDTNKEEDHAD